MKSSSLSLISSEYGDSSDETVSVISEPPTKDDTPEKTKEENADIDLPYEVKQTIICEICGNNAAKYTCPKCEVSTS